MGRYGRNVTGMRTPPRPNITAPKSTPRRALRATVKTASRLGFPTNYGSRSPVR